MKKVFCFSLLLVTILLALTVKTAFAADNRYIYGDGKKSAYSIRLDSPHFSGDVYHVHFYKKTTHLYCMRLDNLQMCDANKSDRSKVPGWLMEKAMKNKSIQDRIKDYNPSLKYKSGAIKALLVSGASVLVILATINIFTGPADDIAAWSLLIAAIGA